MPPTPPHRPNPGFSLNPGAWREQELLLMREVMRTAWAEARHRALALRDHAAPDE
jgi:hypothetical protein